MADNLTLNAGAGGATLATDEVGTDHYQKVKLTAGQADDATPINAGNGLAANALSVTMASDSTGVLSVTELPTPTAITDNFGNPTVSQIMSFSMIWDGSTWDRTPGNSADGMLVNLGANNDVAATLNAETTKVIGTINVAAGQTIATTNAGTFAVQAAIDELPAAAALTDNFANPTTSQIGSFNMVWDGAAWDRAPGNAADGLLVNLGTNNDITGTVTANAGTNLNTSALALEAGNLATLAGAVSGTEFQVDVIASLPTGTNSIGQVTANAGTNLNTSALALESGGNLATLAGAVSGTEMQVDIVASLPAGTNNIGDVDIASAIPAGPNLIGDVGISGARTSGGTTSYRNIDVDETEDAVKASAGQIYWIQCSTIDATPIYLHFYNLGTGSVTVGTTTPDHTFLVPSQGDANGAGFALSIPNGIEFDTAITVAATTTVGGSTGPGLNEVILNLGFA